MKRIALILSFFVVIYGCYFLLTMRKSAETIFIINPHGTKRDASGNSHLTRAYFKTGNSLIKKTTITKAIDDYQLDELFGTYKATLIKQISEDLTTNWDDNTYFYYLKVFSDTEEKAQQICYAIIHSYDERRRENIENTRNEVIAKYKQKIEAQEDKVEELRAKLYKLSKQLAIGTYNSEPQYLLLHYKGREQQSSTLEQILENAKRERNILEILVADFKGLNDKRLITRILATNRPEAAVVRADDTKLAKLKANKNSLIAGGLSDNHPKIVSLNNSIEIAAERLAETVRLTKEKLANDLATMNQRLKKLEEDVLYESRLSLSTGEDHTQFGKIKDAYEREFHILQDIKSVEFSETIVRGLKIEPLQISEPGWTPEIEKMMLARKQKNR